MILPARLALLLGLFMVVSAMPNTVAPPSPNPGNFMVINGMSHDTSAGTCTGALTVIYSARGPVEYAHSIRLTAEDDCAVLPGVLFPITTVTGATGGAWDVWGDVSTYANAENGERVYGWVRQLGTFSPPLPPSCTPVNTDSEQDRSDPYTHTHAYNTPVTDGCFAGLTGTFNCVPQWWQGQPGWYIPCDPSIQYPNVPDTPNYDFTVWFSGSGGHKCTAQKVWFHGEHQDISPDYCNYGPSGVPILEWIEDELFNPSEVAAGETKTFELSIPE